MMSEEDVTDITIVTANFTCACGYTAYNLGDLDEDIVCPRCGRRYELVYYLVRNNWDESEE